MRKVLQLPVCVFVFVVLVSSGCGGAGGGSETAAAGEVPILDSDGAVLTSDQLVERLAEGEWVATAEKADDGQVTAIRVSRAQPTPPGGFAGFEPPEGAIMIDGSVPIRDEDGNLLTPMEMMGRMDSGGYRPEPVHGDDGELVEIVLVRDDSAPQEGSAEGHMFPPSGLSDRWAGEPLPDLELMTLDGEAIGMAELEGKVVVLNFWFRACKPCLMEIPELNELVESFGEDEVVFLAVTFDDDASTREVLEETPFSYRIVTDGQQIHEQFRVASYPTHFVFDADGTCTTAMSGYTPGIGKILEREVRDALEGSG